MKLSRYCQYLISTIKIANWKLHNKGTSTISKSSVFGKSTKISCTSDSTVYIGKSCVISPGVSIEAFGGGYVRLANNVFINRNCQIVAKENIYIGNNCTIGPNVVIYDHDHEIGGKNRYKSSPIFIDENVWIGAGAIILKGVTIGKNSVVSAGAIVTHDVPNDTIYLNRIQPIYKRINNTEENKNVTI